MKNRWLDRNPAHPLPYYTLCLTEAAFAREMKRMNVPSPPPFLGSRFAHATMHTFENDGKLSCIVCLRLDGKRENGEVYGLLIHEAVHIWQEHCKSIGDTPSDEAQAYGIQWISQQLIYEYARQCHG